MTVKSWNNNTLSGLFYAFFYPILSFFQRVFYNFTYVAFFAFLAKARNWGQIAVQVDGEKTQHIFGAENTKNRALIRVKDPQNFFWRCVTKADMGFADAYMLGEVEVDDLTTLFKVFLANRSEMNNLDAGSAKLAHVMDYLWHLRQANTVENSRLNIHKHYDLGNDMFELFLDKTMSYSCAFFKNDNETLEQGQYNKIRMMINKAQIQPHHHLLEIGSGWGALAIEAVKMTGCRVTTVTLSTEQKKIVEDRIKKEGLEGRIQVLLMDYRNVEGQFDRIISVEMLEAVGHEFMPTYFETCSRLLKPDGRMVFQVITTPNKNYEQYRKGCDFIQKYIFPGSLCPSINAVTNAVETTPLVIEDMENIGFHYARTLREWREKFMASRSELLKQGFDDVFIRKWDYYFCYCEAGFAMEYLGDYQIILTKPKYLMEQF